MNHSLRKVSMLIVTIIVLPVMIFSVYEIGSFRQNEKVIQGIYRNQLDAILFSINQYSDDIISNLASRIEHSEDRIKDGRGPDTDQVVKEFPSLKCLIQFDTSFENPGSFPSSYKDSSLIKEIEIALKDNSGTIDRLRNYMAQNYRKIEPMRINSGNLQWIVFMTSVNDRELINVLVIDPEQFIKQVLDPKIQEIAKGKFDIAAYHSGEVEPLYSSNKKFITRKVGNMEQFWLLNDYQMGIELKDLTIADLSRDRQKRGLMIIGIMDAILLLGAWVIFRNIKKQVELSQLKSDFVSGVSHEIRTPLSLITMYIETLDMGRVKDEAKIKGYYKIILNESIRLSGIVNRILSFSQIESNKRKYTFTKGSLNDIVYDAYHSLKYSIDTNGFSYEFEPGNNLPAISVDREAIADAFVNLVDNAMKYSSEIKEIRVKTGTHEKYVYIEVQDSGIGISEKNQKYIFDKFYRVTEADLANKIKGSGLGLSIVKNIIDAHQGKIFLKSSPGSGSLFRLLLPVK